MINNMFVTGCLKLMYIFISNTKDSYKYNLALTANAGGYLQIPYRVSFMKKLFFGILSVAFFFTVLFVPLRKPSKTEKAKTEERSIDSLPYTASSDELSLSDELALKEIQQSYVIVLEGEYLRTYEISGSKRTLLRETHTKPLLMDDKDAQKLKEGIHSESLEDIYLYYESYAS